MNLNGIVTFIRRQSVVPIDTAFGCVAAYNGIAGLMKCGIVNDVFVQGLGPVFATIFNAAYIFAGTCQFFGIGLNKRHVEALGVIILMMSLLVRATVLIYVVGFDTRVVNSYVFSAAFFVGLGVRLINLAQNQTLVATQNIKLQ